MKKFFAGFTAGGFIVTLAIIFVIVMGVITICNKPKEKTISHFDAEKNAQYILSLKIQFPGIKKPYIFEYDDYHAEQGGMSINDTVTVGIVMPLDHPERRPHWRILKIGNKSIPYKGMVIISYKATVNFISLVYQGKSFG